MIDKIQRAPGCFWTAAQNPSMGMAFTSSGGRQGERRFGIGRRAGAIVLSLLTAACPVAEAGIALSHQEAMRIGHKIWQNECGGTVSGLTSWNAGENFASLGIGHFIWYPAGVRGPFEESFPSFVRFVEKRGAKLPDLLLGGKRAACPWNSRQEFLAAESSQGMKNLRIFLSGTIDLQADYMVERLRAALPKMLAAASVAERGKIEERFNRLADRSHGCYALIDYVNFKGEGVLATERYAGHGWGLLQVLAGMSVDAGASPLGEFADSAERVLRARVKNAPPQRNEGRWLEGWLKRVNTYR